MTDAIRINGLRVRGHHGVLPEERRRGQDFVVDATLELAPAYVAAAAASDALADTVDYGGLAEQLADVVAGPPVDLLETLAERLADVCLADPRVGATTVTVHKPQAPINLVFDDVSVTVHRDQPAATRTVAVLSLGSNVGDRAAHLRAAVAGLGDSVLAVSRVYETAPWGRVEQAPFLNAVVLAADQPGVGPAEWLWRIRALEAAALRERTVHWGPRTLDVDLITLSRAGQPISSGDPDLTLPHPRAHERAFVLVPWLDVEPDAELPGHGRVRDLIAGLIAGLGSDDGSGDVRPVDLDLTR